MRVTTELENIPLGDADMLGQLPETIRKSLFGHDTQDLVRNIFHRIVKGSMGITPFKGLFKLFDDKSGIAASSECWLSYTTKFIPVAAAKLIPNVGNSTPVAHAGRNFNFPDPAYSIAEFVSAQPSC